MLKKLFLIGLTAVAVGYVLKKTRVGNYVKHEAVTIQEWANESVPTEKRLKHVRREIDNLDHDVERVRNELAREIVEVRELGNQVDVLRNQADAEELALVRRGEQLKADTETVSYGSYKLSKSEAKDRLKRDVTVHMKKKEHLSQMEKTLAHRERIRETLERQLDELARQKNELRTELSLIETELKTIELEQMESRYQRDDTRLGRVKESLAEMRKRIEIEREKLKLAPRTMTDVVPMGMGDESVDEILAPLAKPAQSETEAEQE